MKINAPIQDLETILNDGEFFGEELNIEVLEKIGFFILKQGLQGDNLSKYRKFYYDEGLKKLLNRSDYHLTEVNINDQHPLVGIKSEENFIKKISRLFLGNIGCDFVRVVKKDLSDYQPVFMHQDTSYQIGGFKRYSCFIALTECGQENGGLIPYPGTHHFGYLGDAGEIADILPSGYPFLASHLNAGDILVMHSATWHSSPENKSKADRVYLEVHLQDANEPTTKWIICGKRSSEWSMHLKTDEIFKDSRTQKIRRLRAELDRLA